MEPGRKVKKLYSVTLIAGFLLFMFMPGTVMLCTKSPTVSITEKRVLEPFPPSIAESGSLTLYFRKIDAYLNDHFGFRDWFVYHHQREMRRWFGIVGAETKVRMGLDNWYYLQVGDMFRDFAGQDGSVKKFNLWYDDFRLKVDWLKRHGIPYLFVVAPNKQSVYPEYVMDDWQRVKKASNLQQLVALHPDIAKEAVVDLDLLLQAHKNEELLYYQSDTHWTYYGAYLAFLHITERLKKQLPGLIINDNFVFSERQQRKCSPRDGTCGDLTSMLLDFPPFIESNRWLQPVNRYRETSNVPLKLSASPLNMNNSTMTISKRAKNKMKVVVFGDSFYGPLTPFFSSNFSEIIVIYKKYDQQDMDEILRQYQPDLVIEEVVERNLFNSY